MKLGKWSVLIAVLLLGSMPAVFARTPKVDTPQVQADTKAKFEIVATEVRKQMVPGGRFQYLTKEEYSKVNNNLNAMAALFDKYGTVAQMDGTSKMALFNDQSSVNAVLTRTDDQRLICDSEKPLGSNIPIRKCRTYGEIERSRNDTQNYLQRLQQVQQPVGGKG